MSTPVYQAPAGIQVPTRHLSQCMGSLVQSNRNLTTYRSVQEKVQGDTTVHLVVVDFLAIDCHRFQCIGSEMKQ